MWADEAVWGHCHDLSSWGMNRRLDGRVGMRRLSEGALNHPALPDLRVGEHRPDS